MLLKGIYFILPLPPNIHSTTSSSRTKNTSIPKIIFTKFFVKHILKKSPDNAISALSGQRYGAVLTTFVNRYFCGNFLLILSTSEAMYSSNSGVRIRMSSAKPITKRPMPA